MLVGSQYGNTNKSLYTNYSSLGVYYYLHMLQIHVRSLHKKYAASEIDGELPTCCCRPVDSTIKEMSACLQG